MKKVLVIGSGGAGKTTFAEQLRTILGIEVVHLDALYWKPGWVEPLKEEWLDTVDDLLKRDSWIMDGNYSGTLVQRLDACDTVVFLDLRRITCIRRVVVRSIKYRNMTRPSMAAGCRERLSFAFLSWIWNFPARTRPRIARLLEDEKHRKRVVWLRTPSEIDRFLAQTKSGGSAINSMLE